MLAVLLVPSAAVAQTVDVFTIDDQIVVPAGTEWDSPVRLGEVCDFDLAIKYNEVFETTSFDTFEVLHITIRDLYKNKSTGLKFLDTADYYIRHDFATGRAFHAGTFWSTKARKHWRVKEVVRDVGTFSQDWTGEYPWPVEELTGPDHDVAAVPFGTLSYCDWAEGNFPR
jgi:hypothetical protein